MIIAGYLTLIGIYLNFLFSLSIEKIYLTFKTVFHPISKHFESCQKFLTECLFFNCLLSVWNYDEIQSPMPSCLIHYVNTPSPDTAYLSRLHMRWLAIKNIPVEFNSNIQNIRLHYIHLHTVWSKHSLKRFGRI